jgi:EAL domain-containing protein (putative c-di-GMP-specific phosphodiesterase class I)
MPAVEAVVSFEALVRWNSDRTRLCQPRQVHPAGRGYPPDRADRQWVLRKACRGSAQLAGTSRSMSTFRPNSCSNPASIAMWSKRWPHRPAAHRLEVEVTESIFLRDASVARNALEQVMALGCSVALDDFGTGYSSLGYLRKLRFSTIKVDRSFVQGAAQGSAESLAIINAVVAMAKSLDMTTTAEGVETDRGSRTDPQPRLRQDPGLLFRPPDDQSRCASPVQRIPARLTAEAVRRWPKRGDPGHAFEQRAVSAAKPGIGGSVRWRSGCGIMPSTRPLALEHTRRCRGPSH